MRGCVHRSRGDGYVFCDFSLDGMGAGLACTLARRSRVPHRRQEARWHSNRSRNTANRHPQETSREIPRQKACRPSGSSAGRNTVFKNPDHHEKIPSPKQSPRQGSSSLHNKAQRSGETCCKTCSQTCCEDCGQVCCKTRREDCSQACCEICCENHGQACCKTGAQSSGTSACKSRIQSDGCARKKGACSKQGSCRRTGKVTR